MAPKILPFVIFSPKILITLAFSQAMWGTRVTLKSMKILICSGLSLNGAAVLSQDSFNFIDSVGEALDVVQSGIEDILPYDPGDSDFRSRLGFATGALPDYPGSDNYRWRVLPIIDLRYKERWRLNGTKLTYNFRPNKRLQAGPLADLRFGRKENRNKALAGLGNISSTVEVGAFVRYREKSLLLSSDIRQALGARQGTTIRATIGHGLYKGERLTLAAAIKGKWLSNRGMQTNFGISPEQAIASDGRYSVFAADSGMSEVHFSVFGLYELRERIRLVGIVQAGHMLGDARDSPLVTEGIGDAFQVVSGIGLIFDF